MQPLVQQRIKKQDPAEYANMVHAKEYPRYAAINVLCYYSDSANIRIICSEYCVYFGITTKFSDYIFICHFSMSATTFRGLQREKETLPERLGNLSFGNKVSSLVMFCLLFDDDDVDNDFVIVDDGDNDEW